MLPDAIGCVATDALEGLMAEFQEPPTIDPDNIPETLCIGRFNLSPGPGPLVMLTFTNVRNRAADLIDNGRLVPESVVRARIVTTIENMVALRDLLNNSIQEKSSDAGAPGGYKLN
jgi:hypothetical protein